MVISIDYPFVSLPTLNKVELIGQKKSCHFHSLEYTITFKINFVCTNNMFQYFFFSIYEERNLVSSFKTPWSVNFIILGLLYPFSWFDVSYKGWKRKVPFCNFANSNSIAFNTWSKWRKLGKLKKVEHYLKILTFRIFYYQ